MYSALRMFDTVIRLSLQGFANIQFNDSAAFCKTRYRFCHWTVNPKLQSPSLLLVVSHVCLLFHQSSTLKSRFHYLLPLVSHIHCNCWHNAKLTCLKLTVS